MGSIRKEIAELLRSLNVASTIALSIVFSVFAGILAGYYLDTKVFKGKTYPWLTIIFLGLGIAGGIKNFFVMMKRFDRGEEKRQGPLERKDQGHNNQ